MNLVAQLSSLSRQLPGPIVTKCLTSLIPPTGDQNSRALLSTLPSTHITGDAAWKNCLDPDCTQAVVTGAMNLQHDKKQAPDLPFGLAQTRKQAFCHAQCPHHLANKSWVQLQKGNIHLWASGQSTALPPRLLSLSSRSWLLLNMKLSDSSWAPRFPASWLLYSLVTLPPQNGLTQEILLFNLSTDKWPYPKNLASQQQNHGSWATVPS